MKVLLLIVSVVVVIVSGQDRTNCQPGVEKFCSRKDGKPKPTACMFTQKSRFNNGDHRNDAKFRERMLERHNFYRSQPYTGLGGPVTGANIVEVLWDEQLEINAWIWADHLAEINRGLEDGKQLAHDPCRVTPLYNSVGQNIAYGIGGDWSKPIDVDEKALGLWNSENVTVPNADVLTKSFTGVSVGNKFIGHYTQLMWAESFRIGCAYVTGESKTYGTQGWIVCNYARAGNFKPKPVFTPGNLGSKCLDGSAPGGAYLLCNVTDVTQFRKSVNVQNSS